MDEMTRTLSDREYVDLKLSVLTALKSIVDPGGHNMPVLIKNVTKEMMKDGPIVTNNVVSKVLRECNLKVARFAPGWAVEAGIEEIEAIRAKLEIEALQHSLALPVIELYSHMTITINVRRDAVEGNCYLLITDSNGRETRVNEINLGKLIYRVKP